jgi:hypothetical protein
MKMLRPYYAIGLWPSVTIVSHLWTQCILCDNFSSESFWIFSTKILGTEKHWNNSLQADVDKSNYHRTHYPIGIVFGSLFFCDGFPFGKKNMVSHLWTQCILCDNFSSESFWIFSTKILGTEKMLGLIQGIVALPVYKQKAIRCESVFLFFCTRRVYCFTIGHIIQ